MNCVPLNSRIETECSILEISVVVQIVALLSAFIAILKISVDDVPVFVRAYRIGQCRDVTVLRLISLGTVEEIIYLRQVYKQVNAPILDL